MIFNANSIRFESLDDDSESQTEIDCNLEIEETFYLAVNSKYILDFLSCINTEDLQMYYNDSNLPFVLVDNNFSTVIMPIVLDK